MQGYELAFAPDFDAEADLVTPPAIISALKAAMEASWKTLARDKIDDETPELPLGKKFWPLEKEERHDIEAACNGSTVNDLVTMLKSRPNYAEVKLIDAAYWVKGCSSLGNLRYAAVLSADSKKKRTSYCLLDFKEAAPPVAPVASGADMPQHNAERVIEGARHLSPYLGKRMAGTTIAGKSMFIRELMPQDLQIEIEKLNPEEATKVSTYFGAVVGKAHSRQMNPDQRKTWLALLKERRSPDLEAPLWLWSTVIDLLVVHEKAYLEHCRRYALSAQKA